MVAVSKTHLIVIATLISFASFYAHELGHYLSALALGYDGLRLTPVMVVVPELRDHAHEIIVAGMGPLVSALLALVAAPLSRRLRSPGARTLAAYAALINGIVVASVLIAAFVPGTDGHRLLGSVGWPARAAATALGVLAYWNLWRLVPWYDGRVDVRRLFFLVYALSLVAAALLAGAYVVMLLILPGISLLTIGFVDPGVAGPDEETRAAE